MADDFEFKGLEDVLKRMRGLSDKGITNATRRSLRKGANVVRDAARENAQRLDDPNTPESIAKNITTRSMSRRSTGKNAVGLKVGVRGGARDMGKYGEFKGKGKGNPGGDTWYWRLLEFGTSKMTAKPFMRPALSDNRDKSLAAVRSDLPEQIDKELKKLK